MIKFCKNILIYFTCKLAKLARGRVDDITAKKISEIMVKMLSNGTNRYNYYNHCHNYCHGCGYVSCCIYCYGCNSPLGCQKGIYKWLRRG